MTRFDTKSYLAAEVRKVALQECQKMLGCQISDTGNHVFSTRVDRFNAPLQLHAQSVNKKKKVLMVFCSSDVEREPQKS